MAVHEVPASKASIKQNQFEFKVPGERKTRSLPLMQYLPLSVRGRMGQLAAPIKAAKDRGEEVPPEDLNALGQMQLDMLERFSPGITDLLDNDQLAWLLTNWEKASTISMGESKASAGS